MTRRLLWFVGLVVGAAVLLQVLLWAAPGDAIDVVGDASLRAGLTAEWGLDQPLPVRMFRYGTAALQGDLGTSLTVRPGAGVAQTIATAAARSAAVLIPALLLSGGLALAMSLWGRRWRVVQAISVAPVFLIAHMLVLGLNEATFALVQQGSISRPDWFALPLTESTLRSALAITILAVGSGALSTLSGELRAEVRKIQSSGYIEAARARGASLLPHILGNLLPPLMVSLASQVAFLMGGLIILERVLLLGGAGSLLWESALQRDYPLAMGLGLLAAVVVCGARLVSDVSRIMVDPRLRQSL